MSQRPDLSWCLLIALAGLAWLSLGDPRRARAHDRPAGPLHKTRSAVIARQGMAATSQPLATATAIQDARTTTRTCPRPAPRDRGQ